MAGITKNNFKFSNIWIFFAIILIGFALYFVPLHSASFYYDDIRSIEQNDVIKTVNIPAIFDAFNTRFLVGLSFALNYKICGLHPSGYRIINLLIHCINAFLVYLLIKVTLYLYQERQSNVSNQLKWPALFGALLFLCHPIQTEPVNFITQRFVLMGTFFYLAALMLYVKSRSHVGTGLKPAPTGSVYYLCSLIAAIAAMFCKEFVVTLPVMIALYDFYFLNSVKETMWRRCRLLLPYFLIILIVPILLSRTPSEASIVANIADSSTVQVKNGQKLLIDITRAHGGVSRQRYFLTELNVMCTYVRLLFLPINQNLDYDYPLFSKMDIKTIVCGAFIVCLFVIAGMTYRLYRIVSFSILWFFIALSVESSVIPIAHVIAEYRPYLASVGFVLLVSDLIYMSQVDIKKINMIALAILIGFSIFTFQRNKIWRDEFTLWTDVVLKSPYKARPYNNLGLSNDHKGNFEEALRDYKKVMELTPNDPEAYYNSGIIYGKLGAFSQALAEYNMAIQLNPNYADAYSNRATIFYLVGNYAQAVSDYTQAIGVNSNMAVLYLNRGNAYNKLGRLTQALDDYRKVIELNPDYATAYDDLAVTYYQLKEYDKAWECVHKLEKLPGPYDPMRISAIKKVLAENK